MFCLLNGTPIAYSSPSTMMDKSSKIKKGCKGDMTVVRPTVIIGVPLMLGRIYNGIQSQIESGPPIKKAIFDFAVKYKQDWYQKGYDTPILNGYKLMRFYFTVIRRFLIFIIYLQLAV